MLPCLIGSVPQDDKSKWTVKMAEMCHRNHFNLNEHNATTEEGTLNNKRHEAAFDLLIPHTGYTSIHFLVLVM